MSPSTPAIRAETAEDSHAIRRLLLTTFPSDAEAAVGVELRTASSLPVSLVAVESRRVVGHIAFSPVSIEPQPHKACMILGLAPFAVAQDAQRRGIGSALVQAGLKACAAAGWDGVLVLGDPGYYRRFGFVPAAERRLRRLFDAPPEAFMTWETASGTLPVHEAMVPFTQRSAASWERAVWRADPQCCGQ